MRGLPWATLGVILFCLSGQTALAQDKPAPKDPAQTTPGQTTPAQTTPAQTTPAVPPKAMDVYADTDPQAPLKRAVEKRLGVYLVHPPRRHAAERVRIKGKRATVDVWHPVGNRSDTWLKARAVQWLVEGRTQWSGGARAVFSDIETIDEVRLRFIEVIRPTRKSRRLRHKKKERIKPYLVLSIRRSRVDAVDLGAVAECVARHDCNRLFSGSFSSAKFDKKHTAKRRKEG